MLIGTVHQNGDEDSRILVSVEKSAPSEWAEGYIGYTRIIGGKQEFDFNDREIDILIRLLQKARQV